MLFTGISIKTTLDNAETLKYCGLIAPLVEKARRMIKEFVVDEEENTSDDISFIRLRTKLYEILIAPGKSGEQGVLFPFKYICSLLSILPLSRIQHLCSTRVLPKYKCNTIDCTLNTILSLHSIFAEGDYAMITLQLPHEDSGAAGDPETEEKPIKE